MKHKCYAFFLIFFVASVLLVSSSYAELIAPYFWAYDYETYDEEIDTVPLPERFVYYEDVSFLGDFDTFHGLGDMYYYYEMLASEKEFIFMINSPSSARKDPESFPKSEIAYTEMEDLRFLQNAPGRVSVKDVEYLYGRSGELVTIWWMDSYGTKVLVFAHGVPEGGFWEELLNPKTVEVALEKLFRATKTEQSEADATTDVITSAVPPSDSENAAFPWLWIALPVGMAAIGGGAAAFFLIRKKRRKAAVTTPEGEA